MLESAADDLDARYLRGLRHVPVAAGVVTTRGTSGAFGQRLLGLAPFDDDGPGLLCVLAGGRDAVEAIRSHGSFRATVLAAGQDGLADEIADGAALPPLDPERWDADAPAGPEARGAVASFSCRLTELRDGPALAVVFGRVTEVTARPDAEPLLRLNHTYRRVEELPLPMFPGFAPASHERTTSAR